jgi:MFS family permease
MALEDRTMAAGAVPLRDPRLFRQRCYVDGRWIEAESGATVPVTNPATGEVLGTVPKLGKVETRAAIQAAERAWVGITLNIILMTVFGGIGTVLGPVIGPFVFMALSETLWAQFPFVHRALLGVAIVLLVLFLPRGIMPALRMAAARLRPGRSVRADAPR